MDSGSLRIRADSTIHGNAIMSDMPLIADTTERLLGVLIERTEALREETGALQIATGDLKAIHVAMRLVLQNVADRLIQLEGAPEVPNLAGRLAACEATAKDYRHLKDKALAWSLRVAAAALLLAAGGSAMSRLMFGS
jgi:hypothetical protein